MISHIPILFYSFPLREKKARLPAGKSAPAGRSRLSLCTFYLFYIKSGYSKPALFNLHTLHQDIIDLITAQLSRIALDHIACVSYISENLLCDLDL